MPNPSLLARDADPAPIQVGYACGCVRPMQQRLGTPGHCETHGAPIRKCGIAFESGAEESWTELVRLREECRAKDAVILAAAEKIACMSAHLAMLAERKTPAESMPLEG